MERETGVEPATSSLGISASIEYKGHGVHRGDTDPWSSATYGHSFVNSPLMEWKWRVTVPYTFADKILGGHPNPANGGHLKTGQ
jgi:hypothetical protein